MHSYQSLKTSLILIKWLKIKEINIMRLEKLSKRLKNKLFLINRLNTQFPITSFLLFKS